MMKRTYLKLSNLTSQPRIMDEKMWSTSILFLDAGLIDYNPDYYPEFESDEVKHLFARYIYPRYSESPIAYIDKDLRDNKGEPTADEYNETRREVAMEILNWLQSSHENYIQQIKLWKENKAKLLDAVKSKSKVFYNDTPQDEKFEIMPEEEKADFTTNTTTSVSEAETGTTLQRLNEVNRTILDIYEQWRIEFELLFIIK